MNILILHNNSLPIDIIDMAGRSDFKNRYTSIVIKQSLTDEDSFDTFVTKHIEKIFTSGNFDVVVLSFNLSAENHADYSGVTLGLHLRLSKPSSRLPLLFLGKDRPDQIAKLKDQGSLFFTPKVFVCSANRADDLDSYISSHECYLKSLSDNEYRKFLERIKIGDIENYGPHAIANIWAVKRWQDMLFDDGFCHEITEDPRRSQLNFKYIDQLAQINDARQVFKKPQQQPSCLIPTIASKSIVYIDDEVNHGWGQLLETICDRSDAYLDCWAPADLKNRKEVVESICSFVDGHKNADCYIVDLRLAEEDTNETDFTQLSGHIVSRYIKQLNKANQVVILTASNKIWNLKEEVNEIGALGYALKESPAMNLNRIGSKMLYSDFIHLVSNACSLSQLKKLVAFQERIKNLNYKLNATHVEVDLSGLYNCIDLILLDKDIFTNCDSSFGKTPISSEIIKSVILSLCVFVETYMKTRYLLKDDTKHIAPNGVYVESVQRMHSDVIKEIYGHVLTKSVYEDGYLRTLDVIIKDEIPSQLPENWSFLTESVKSKDNSLPTVLASAYAFYHLPENMMKVLVKFKDLRNTVIAHNSGKSEVEFNVKYEEIESFYDVIIDTLFKTDYPDLWEKC